MTSNPTAAGAKDEPVARNILGDGVVRVRAARLGVAVVQDLVTAIVTGEVAPGDILPPEGVLSQQFAVSRTVIRESVKRVEEKGLVTVSQGRGTIVNPPTMWNVLDPDVLSALVDHDETLEVLDELAIVRGSLEATMARAAAARQTPERTAELRAAFDRSAANVGDLSAYNTADAAFHDVVMEQSGIRLAANITRIMFTRARESRRFTGNSTDDAAHITLEEHRAVLEAIIAGDGDRAATAMREHIANAWARRRAPGME
jgi:GntR family galactonate operon transcriptional repressor